MIYPSVNQIIRINANVLAGAYKVRDADLLDSAVMRPQASAFGQDAYPTIYEKAAALLHSLVLNHPFNDGNKRTATLAALLFLGLNGVILRAASGVIAEPGRVKRQRHVAVEGQPVAVRRAHAPGPCLPSG